MNVWTQRSVRAWLVALAASGLACSDETTGSTATDTGAPSGFVDIGNITPRDTTDGGPLTDTPRRTSDDGDDGDAPTGPTGAFGAPCKTTTDCDSGYCVESSEGRVCTELCVDTCPGGWSCVGITNTGADATFICLPDSSALCAPCTADLQCGAGYCTALNDGRFCTQACSDDKPCPDGFTCQELAGEVEGEAPSLQCAPVSGGCTCTKKGEGLDRPCFLENEQGKCWGTQTCGGDAGWGACSAHDPIAEECDGLDNDCDGLADEELCDYQDNDCDGSVDEDFRDEATGLYDDDGNCALCNNSCAGAVAFSEATACAITGGKPSCIATSCQPGYFITGDATQICVPLSGGFDCSPCVGDGNCTDLPGGACVAMDGGTFCSRACVTGADCPDGTDCAGGHCVPVSNSCSCLPANQGATRSCFDSNAAGVCFGVQTCDATKTPGWSTCTAAQPKAEECDDVDNNCNGLVDEGVAHDPALCENQNPYGSCQGDWACGGTKGWLCPAATPEAEACNGKDDDCDGLIDDGLPQTKPCSVTNVFGTCEGQAVCVGTAGWICQAQTPALEACDYQDNNCDGVVDEGYADAGGKYTEPTAARAASRARRASPTRPPPATPARPRRSAWWRAAMPGT